MLSNLREVIGILRPDQLIHIQGYAECRVRDIPEELKDIKVRYIKNNIDCIEVFTYG